MTDRLAQPDLLRLPRAARAAAEAVLVVCIGLQGGAAGGLIGWMLRTSGELGRSAQAPDGPLEAWFVPVGSLVGALLTAFVAGWWVLGGWRGGLRALAVVVLAGAGFGGTLYSPILAERLLPVSLGFAATLAGFGAGAMGGVVLTVIAPPPRVAVPRPAASMPTAEPRPTPPAEPNA